MKLLNSNQFRNWSQVHLIKEGKVKGIALKIKRDVELCKLVMIFMIEHVHDYTFLLLIFYKIIFIKKREKYIDLLIIFENYIDFFSNF